MKKTLFQAVFIIISLVLISCATTPKKGERPEKKESKGKTEDEYRTSADTLQKETEALIGAVKDIKANVTMKDDFAKAQSVYDEAMKQYNDGKFKKAAATFEDAKSLFNSIYSQTTEKKTRAERSIEDANREMQAVEEKAKAAGLK